ncbi:SUMF1/EgtB/PvdO family nonheme iron enzyme [Bradyrhizobium sp. 1.29L]
MTPKAKQAIGRIVAIRGDGGEVYGTAFVVSDRFLMTAFHVVGDRAVSIVKGTDVCFPALYFYPASAGVQKIPVKVVAGCCDPLDDWALLELEEPLPGVVPLPMGEITTYELETSRRPNNAIRFDSWGFPGLARMAGSGIAIDGRVQDQDARYQGAWAYQLYSDNAAAALGEPLSGLSGAPCLIDGAVVGIIRSNLVMENKITSSRSVHIAGGILYACPVATETLQQRCAPYLPALDPIRGLPGLPRQTLPREPFRYLHWYGAEHVEVFFGRNRRIRDLYYQVADPDTPALVLVYGASGVGKSSLMQAGVLPRLSLTFAVRAHRRESGKSLEQCLEDLLAKGGDGDAGGKPIIFLIDQIEEVFIDTCVDGNAELAALFSRIKAVLGSRSQLSKIILSFRSEWLANVRARLFEADICYSEFYLERLTRDEIEDVVRGVSSTARLRKFYGVQVDERLPDRVADDLLDDPDSPISPLLSIILTRLWTEAKARRAGEQRLDEDVYEERMRAKLDLDQFLTEQIKAVSMSRPVDVASGLVIDVLYRHTTDQGTAKELSRKQLKDIYYHLGEEGDQYLDSLLESLCAVSLLYTAVPEESSEQEQAGRMTRLAHDTLAVPVRKHFQRSDLPGQRAERRLASWVEDWLPSEPEHGTLDSASLALIAQGARGTRGPTEKERNFMRASVEARRLATRRSLVGQFLVGALVTSAGLGLIGWWQEAFLKEQIWWLRHVRGHVLSLAAERSIQVGAVFKECVGCPEMVVIPVGAFAMGGSAEAEAPDEARQAQGLLRVTTQSVVGSPQHKVSITKPLAVGRYEVTFDEWDACFAAGGCKTPGSSQSWGRGRRPVINISWDDSKEYAAWLSRMTGKEYRLLSEAEWEFAARAGTETLYSWGNEVGAGRANCNGCGSEWDNDKTAPVGSFKPNKFGLYDMHGNVWEWVEDCFSDNYADAPSDGSPSLTGNCNRHVIRGGSWITVPRAMRSANRHRDDVNGRYFATGVRIARTLKLR